MKRLLKKFWHWLRCEDENGNPTDSDFAFYPGRYSENVKRFPLKEGLTPDDILQISHKRNADGNWVTCFITVKQLKEAIINL